MKTLSIIFLIFFALNAHAQTTFTTSSFSIGGTQITGVKSVIDADSLSGNYLATIGLVYRSIRDNKTTFYKENASVLGDGTIYNPFRVNPYIVVQKGNTAYIKANAREGQVWYNTETHTIMFHNGYGTGLRSVNTSNVP